MALQPKILYYLHLNCKYVTRSSWPEAYNNMILGTNRVASCPTTEVLSTSSQ